MDEEYKEASETYISNRFIIQGLSFHFIDIVREIVNENKILKIPLMREYDLSESELNKVIGEIQTAGILNANNQVVIDKESLEKFLDIYEPSLFECKNTAFDKETFMEIGKEIFKSSFEKVYDILPADELMEYLDIMEKLNIVKYDTKKNTYNILTNKEQYLQICDCIPNSFSSTRFDTKTNEFDNMNYDSLTGIEFEKFCAYILSKNGFENIKITPPSGDHGIDVIAERKEVSYAIQCKCYSGNVGNSSVQQAHTGRTLYKKDIAVVMTNSHFTSQAMEEAAALNVKLWDRNKLNSMIYSAMVD
nr:restriction endonuclease [uncultured Schaedlerella sp.]